MKPNPYKQSSCFRLLAGWCALLLYVGALSPIGFAVTAFFGELDSDHHLLFHPGEKGMRLVLHHEGDCAAHHHGAVARVLTAFAQPASATDPDHVLQFSSATGLLRDSQGVVPAANSSANIAVVVAEPLNHLVVCPVQFAVPPCPPPDVGGQLLALRSTVLLI